MNLHPWFNPWRWLADWSLVPDDPHYGPRLYIYSSVVPLRPGWATLTHIALSNVVYREIDANAPGVLCHPFRPLNSSSKFLLDLCQPALHQILNIIRSPRSQFLPDFFFQFGFRFQLFHQLNFNPCKAALDIKLPANCFPQYPGDEEKFTIAKSVVLSN